MLGGVWRCRLETWRERVPLLGPVLLVRHLKLLLMDGRSFGSELGFHRRHLGFALGLRLDPFAVVLALGLGGDHGMDGEEEENAEQHTVDNASLAGAGRN